MMKKAFLLMALSALSLGVMAQGTQPQWTIDLVNQNPGVIDSVRAIPARFNTQEELAKMDPATAATMPTTEADLESQTYMIYYHQPLQHSNPTGEQFSLRATITVPNNANVATAVNAVYIGGYALMKEMITNPDMYYILYKNWNGFEVARRYNGILIMPEFRYFQYSSPVQCYTKLEHLTSQEAADDFHNLLVALKKVLGGKWAIYGVSKGGITTLLQHVYHPEDADVFVPYCAPFFDSVCDTTMQHYWYNNGWNQEYLDMFMNIRRNMLAYETTVYPLYKKLVHDSKAPKTEEEYYGRYLSGVVAFGFTEHAYQDTAALSKAMVTNQQAMASRGMTAYNDTVYAIMLRNASFELKGFADLVDWLRDPQNAQAPERAPMRIDHAPRSVSETDWWGQDTIGKNEQAYEYQSKTELGYYDYRFDELVAPEVAADWNATYKQYVGVLRDFYNPCFKSFPFERTVYDRAVSTTQNATKPIVFIYGEDDTWTGAAMKDQYINGTNVQKFILPGQNHSVRFTSNTDQSQCDAIRTILDGVLGAPQALEDAARDETTTTARKVMRNGQILILRDNKVYTITGTEVQ